MKYIASLAGAITIAAFATNAMAEEAIPQPQKCPSATSLKAAGISKFVFKLYNSWIAGRRDVTGDTTDHWTYAIGNIFAQTTTQAYNKALSASNTLAFQVGPLPGPFNTWFCMYNTQFGNPAIAVTPALVMNDVAKILAIAQQSSPQR